MTYLHIDLTTVQSPKHEGQPCGDVVECVRGSDGTTFVLADGVGHGVRANLGANFVTARLLEKLRTGASLRQSFSDVIETLETNRSNDLPWAAFTLVRVAPHGDATVLSYESPPPLLVSRRHAHILPQRSLAAEHSLITQANCTLVPGDALLIMSDGVTQAGLGRTYTLGWGIEGVCREANMLLGSRVEPEELPARLHAKAGEIDGAQRGDDTTAVLAACREGVVVNIFTGPPVDLARDGEVVREFMLEEGYKVVCGGTTAGVVARELEVEAKVDRDSLHPYTPPRYEIEGIDLSTEGAICLNQLYNIFDDPQPLFEERTAVSDLYDLLQRADRVRIIAGRAANAAGNTMQFRQQGILSRPQIVPLLAKKLEAAGKLVEVEWV